MLKKISKSKELLLFSSLVWSLNNCYASEDIRLPSVIGLSGLKQQSRSSLEANLMVPFWQDLDKIALLDIKIKGDNKKSLEGNFGLAFRRNFSDRIILGMYGYFDRRKTGENLFVNQLTLGLEAFSHYLDGRLNVYIPQKKEKILIPARNKIVREGTRIYGMHYNSVGVRAIPGYDVEGGVPLFAFSERLDNKLGTRIFLGHYKFSRKGIPAHSGIRIRAEQPIIDNLFDRKGIELTLHLGSNYTKQKKWNTFGGLTLRKSFSKYPINKEITKLQKRMISPIIRDLDIITQASQPQPQKVPVYHKGKEVKNIYFVGESLDDNYEGEGTYEKPFSRKQLTKLIKEGKFIKTEADLIHPIQIDKQLTILDYQRLVTQLGALDVVKEGNIDFETSDHETFKLASLQDQFPSLETKIITKDSIIITNIDNPSLDNLIKNQNVTLFSYSNNNVQVQIPIINQNLPQISTQLAALLTSSLSNQANNILAQLQNNPNSVAIIPLANNQQLALVSPALQQIILVNITEQANIILNEIINNQAANNIVPIASNPALANVSPSLQALVQNSINAQANNLLDRILRGEL